MTIKTRTAYYAVCDCCGCSVQNFRDGNPALWWNEKSVTLSNYYGNWLKLNGLDLCSECWTVNDDDQHIRAHVVHPADEVSES